MSIWFGQNLQWSKVIFWFRLYLVFYHRSVGEADIFFPGHGLYDRKLFQGRIPKPSRSISTGDIGLRWKRFRNRFILFNRILWRTLVQIFRHTRRNEREGTSRSVLEERARNRWLVVSVEPVFRHPGARVHHPDTHPFVYTHFYSDAVCMTDALV